jgi:hypothetical protein
MEITRPKARTFRDLTVWRKAHEFVLEIYRFTSVGIPQKRNVRSGAADEASSRFNSG